MESFSLLKYWRGGGLATSVSPSVTAHGCAATLGATVLRCAAPGENQGGDVDDEECSSSLPSADEDDEEGPFFDLEFAVPDDEDDGAADVVSVVDGSEENGGEFGFSVETAASATQSVGLTPSHDELFFKGRLVPLETTSSAAAMTASLVLEEPNSRQHQFLPVSTLLKSATRFRVFTLGLKKTGGGGGGEGGGGGGGGGGSSVAKTSGADLSSATVAPSPKHPHSRNGSSSKFFTVKYLKVVEEVPIMSLFTRDNSSRSSSNKGTASTGASAARQSSSSDLESPIAGSSGGSGSVPSGSSASSSCDEKKSSKELVHKYLNKIKPLYVRVSGRHADKLEQQQLLRSSPGHQQVKASAAASAVAWTTIEAAKESVDSLTPVADATGGDPKPHADTPDTRTSEKQQQQLQGAAASKPTTTGQKEKLASMSASAASQHLHAGLRVVCRHLGKSRSASSAAVAAAPSPAPPAVGANRRRDDSLLQQQDGIQSAIAHCKRSFNATTADHTVTSAAISPALPRSRSDPCDEHRSSSGGGGAEIVA